jgi:hypothetical protein
LLKIERNAFKVLLRKQYVLPQLNPDGSKKLYGIFLGNSLPDRATGLLGVDLEIDIDLWAVIELADRFGVAFVAVELGVNLVIDRGETGKTVSAVFADDVGFYGVGTGVGEIHDRVGDRIVMLIEDFAVEQAALLLILVGSGVGSEGKNKKKCGSSDEETQHSAAHDIHCTSGAPRAKALDHTWHRFAALKALRHPKTNAPGIRKAAEQGPPA